MVWRVFKTLLKVEFIETIRYGFHLVMSYVITFLFFSGIYLGVSSLAPSAFSGGGKASFFVGYIYWIMYLFTANSVAWTLFAEAMRGYIERLFINPLNPKVYIFLKIIASFLASFFHTFIVGFILSLIFGIKIDIPFLPFIIVILPVFVFFVSIAFVFAGFTLVYKRINAFINLVQILLMLLSFLVSKRMPEVVLHIFKFFPYTQGLYILKNLILWGKDINWLFTSGEYLYLFIGSILFFILGLLVFDLLYKKSLREGLLGQY